MTKRSAPGWHWLCLVVLCVATLPGPAAAQDDAEDDSPLHAIVLLLEAPRAVTEAEATELVAGALGVEIDPDDPDAADWVIGEEHAFIVQVDGWRYLINVFDTPYVEDKEAVAEGLEPDLAEAVLRHDAWLSVDLLFDIEGLDADEVGHVYQNLGRLAAALLDEDVTALYATYSGDLLPYDPASETAALLTEMHPLLVIAGITEEDPPIIQVEADDPRMLAAVATARERWPEFVEAFPDRAPDDAFIVKFGFPTDNPDMEQEYMWLQVESIDDDTVTGILDNEPAHADVAYGDRVTRPIAELNDWLIIRDGEWTGGFTIEVLRQAQEEAQADEAGGSDNGPDGSVDE